MAYRLTGEVSSNRRKLIHPEIQEAYRKVRETGGVVQPRRVEPLRGIGSTDVESDDEMSLEQLAALMEEQRRLAPTLTIKELFRLVFANNPKLPQMPNREPDFHTAATSKSDIGAMTPKAAYEKLYEMAEKQAEREDITVEQAFAKEFEKNTPLARANMHSLELGVEEQAAGETRNKNLWGGGIAPRIMNAK